MTKYKIIIMPAFIYGHDNVERGRDEATDRRRRPSLLSSWTGCCCGGRGAWLIVMQRQDIYTQLHAPLARPPFAHTHTHVRSRIEIFFSNLRTKLIYHRESNRRKKPAKLCSALFRFLRRLLLLLLLFSEFLLNIFL